MSSTIRTYRHNPTQAADATGTLVDTETDADDGPFTVTVDTTGWDAGSYQVSVTREYTTGGLSESAKSNPLDVTANAAGNSDTFTGSVGTHLADHNANWAAAIGSIDNLTLNGSGQLRGTAEELAAFYSTSTSDTVQVVIKANTDTALGTFSGVLVRASASHWYNIHLEGVSAGDYTTVKTQRDGGTTFAVSNAITGYSRGADHTLRVSVATVGATVEISSWLDGNFIATRVDTDAERIASGSPGLLTGRYSGADTNGNLDDWQDY